MQKELNLKHEQSLLQKYELIVGIDEAGRGPWAGPVAVGFFVVSHSTKPIMGVTDSKKLSPKKRKEIYSEIYNGTHGFCLLASNEEIDKTGIGNTITNLINQGIKRIQKNSPEAKIRFLIDGYFKETFDCDFELVKRGDSRYYSIAAASIIAKVTRDTIMCKYDKRFDKYGFATHKGYGTKYHKEMLEKYGPCDLHRRSFRPIQQLLTPQRF